MPDGDSIRLSPQRRLADLLQKVKGAQKEALNRDPRDGGPITDKAGQVQFIQGRIAIYSLTVTDALLENFIEQNLTDKATKKHGGGQGGKSPSFWDLDETLIVAHKDGSEVKPLGKFTVVDGDQLSRQKDTNVESAVRARKVWDWQWKLIRPLLIPNPDWVFEDAYNHLVSSGGLPTPPDFDDDADQ